MRTREEITKSKMLNREQIIEAYHELRNQTDMIRDWEEEYRIVPEFMPKRERAKFEARDALLWMYDNFDKLQEVIA